MSERGRRSRLGVFGSSGGAVTGIALALRHPEQVRTLVAHERPAVTFPGDHDGFLGEPEAFAETLNRCLSADEPGRP